MALNELDYALVIGIDDYPEYTPLDGAKADAKRFAKWLIDRETGGGLPDDHCKLVLSSSDPLAPTWDEINDKLIEIYDMARAAEKRRFYFYFSGHGQTLTSSDVNLCLARWSNQEHGLRMALSYVDWKTTIVDCTGFTEIFFLLDCCRTRVYGGGGLPCSLSCPKPDAEATTAKTFVGFATEFQNLAREAERSAAANAQPIYGGHFTEALLAGLNGGAASADGGVPAQRLKEYLEQWTPRIAREAKHPEQRAEVINGLSSYPAPPILGSARPDGTLTVTFGSGRRGPIRLLAPDDRVVHEAGADSSLWQVAEVRYGRYRLVDMATQDEKEFDFQPREVLSRVTFD